MKNQILAAWAVLTLAACGSDSLEPIPDPSPDPSDPVQGSLPPEVQEIVCPEVAYQSDFEEGLTEHVTGPHRFLDLYLGADTNSQEEPPEVDFDQVDVLAVLAGAQPNGGYMVYISDIHQQGDDIEVVYQLVGPSLSECSAADVMTYPYCFVSIPKVQGNVQFTEENISACGFEWRDEG